MNVGVISLGCVKNRVDTEQMLSILSSAGHTLTDHAEEADVLIVNTCGFINAAKEESIDTILEMAQFKETGKCRLLCVTGCLSQRYGKELRDDIPEADLIVGVSQYDLLPDLIEKALTGQKILDTSRRESAPCDGRILTTKPYTAYIRIGEGCDNRCAYCAIPLIRGNHRSRPQGEVLQEMSALAAKGAREQILIAQDTTRYGRDLNGTSLQSLLREAAGIPGVDWLRVLYCYPDETNTGLIDEMAVHDNVCRYLDLPLQHASPALLKKMNRRGDINEAKELLLYARSKGFALRTTFIVGFPGETEEDFEMLMQFTRDMAFDRMGAFTFSPEEDTAAFNMPSQVPEKTKQARLDRLMALQNEISLSRNQLRVGTVEKVLVTGHANGYYTARSAWEAPDADGIIRIETKDVFTEGTFVMARIVSADAYDLSAVPLKELK